MDSQNAAKILVVDDDQMILDSFSACFKSMGLQVIDVRPHLCSRNFTIPSVRFSLLRFKNATP
jgi:DNA-binding NtrC family response regulator